MKNISLQNHLIILLCIMFSSVVFAQESTISLDTFNEIIVSPHIQVTFQKGDSSSVEIKEQKIASEKLNIEVKNNTLHIYLDGAKITSPTQKIKKDGYEQKVPIYKGTLVKAVITYTTIERLSLRGEERFVFESPIQQDAINFKIYGESEVYINEIDVEDFRTTIYGESYLKIKKGNIQKQKFTCYGESEIDVLDITNATTKITAYGDGDYSCNVSERLKVTAFGEATIGYTGNPKVSKGLVIGETRIKRL